MRRQAAQGASPCRSVALVVRKHQSRTACPNPICEASVTDRRTQRVRHRDFYRELDAILNQIDRSQGFEELVSEVLEQVTLLFGEYIGLESARLYRDDGDGYVVLRSFGPKGSELLGFRVDRGYEVLSHIPPLKTVYFPPGDPRIDPVVEEALGVDQFAAFLVGPTRDYIAAFGLSPDADVPEALLILSTLRHAMDTRLRQSNLEGQILEATSIQTSLFPETAPSFPGFDLAGKSVPADAVGGDIFDFLPVAANQLGIAVGDASGHGLPAALQARDVMTGLRMGVEKDLKITAVFTRLNRVINHSGLSTRFVSLFYGELESNGNLVYVNAGHDPGLLVRRDGEMEYLRSTGLVLGPMENLEYRRAWVEMDPGDVLVLYTDGVVERQGPKGDYGRERLEEYVAAAKERGADAQEMVTGLIEDVREFGQFQAFSDDVTAVVLRRLPA